MALKDEGMTAKIIWKILFSKISFFMYKRYLIDLVNISTAGLKYVKGKDHFLY